MLVPFKVEHLLGFEPREEERELLTIFGDFSDRIEHLADKGECFSFIKDSKLIAFGGIYEVWSGLGEVWMIPSSNFKDYQMEGSRHLRNLFKGWSLSFNRIQTTSRNDRLHNRFMKFLGLEKDGVLNKFGPKGEDFAIFSKVKK